MRLLRNLFRILKIIVNSFMAKYDSYKYRKDWRTLNHHNESVAKNKFNISQVKVGMYTYGD